MVLKNRQLVSIQHTHEFYICLCWHCLRSLLSSHQNCYFHLMSWILRSFSLYRFKSGMSKQMTQTRKHKTLAIFFLTTSGGKIRANLYSHSTYRSPHILIKEKRLIEIKPFNLGVHIFSEREREGGGLGRKHKF